MGLNQGSPGGGMHLTRCSKKVGAGVEWGHPMATRLFRFYDFSMILGSDPSDRLGHGFPWISGSLS